MHLYNLTSETSKYCSPQHGAWNTRHRQQNYVSPTWYSPQFTTTLHLKHKSSGINNHTVLLTGIQVFRFWREADQDQQTGHNFTSRARIEKFQSTDWLGWYHTDRRSHNYGHWQMSNLDKSHIQAIFGANLAFSVQYEAFFTNNGPRNLI